MYHQETSSLFISIVTLNWNSFFDTQGLLKSIEKSDYPKNKYEVIVVDNGSSDGSVEKIAHAYPKTRIISLSENIGTSARNIGIKKAKGEIIITADSDALVQKDTLLKVVKKVREDPEIGILGVKIINRRKKTPEFSPMHVNFFTGAISMLSPNLQTTHSTFLPFILSAIPRKTINRIGLIDPAFFFYGEDMDFCLRLRSAGLKVLYWPETYVYHDKSKTTPDIPHSIKYHHYYKALFRNIYKYGNLAQKVSMSLFQLLLIPLYRLIISGQNTFGSRWWGFCWNLKNWKK
jgi:GT2 family glycosyltransferase